MTSDSHPARITGLVLHNAAFYDFTVGLMTLGRERAFRRKLCGLAGVVSGEAVLDIGCGTGSLAIEAKRQVGPRGVVCGIDASSEMLERAQRKARKANCAITFKQAAAQALPFPDRQFDAVLSTVMLHHLPRKGREDCLGEAKRVLKQGGRLLVVEFGLSESHGHSLSRLHRHGHVKFDDMIAMLEGAGFRVGDSGPLGYRNLHFALAVAP